MHLVTDGEWMMGLPAGWVTDVLPRSKALKALGNGVVPHQAAAALRLLLDGDVELGGGVPALLPLARERVGPMFFDAVTLAQYRAERAAS